MREAKVLKRVLYTIPIMLAIAITVFIFMRFTPGDPVDIMMGKESMVSQQDIELLKKEFNLDKPIYTQLYIFLTNLLKGDLGKSITKGVPVIELIKETLPATIELALAALTLGILIGIPIGIISAVKQNSWLDRSMMAISFTGISMPSFWLGLILILIFSAKLNLFPSQGRINFLIYIPKVTGFYTIDSLLSGDWEAFVSSLRHLFLPALTLAAPLAAVLARVMRSSMLEVLRNDYVVFARAKGVPEKLVILKHAVRNALIPTVTVLGMEVGALLGGNMIVENVFGWPGIGRLVVTAIFDRDYPLVQGVVMFYAFTFVIANLLVDILYTYLDPKIEL
ncbi:ABC transporter permease [Caldanaerobacter subterraneus]|uniref:Peptide ABC transporter permease n=2 Tax=Caldanaerobacter subterraneus TaxID=911092 RepID=U5CTF2_CALSX|nr:ABC transporter permease [Caldanaerobacter subterraneus]ERM91372.1 peptide ABC transporter permease [Caldanaerobacter subterraneus subsp. yonseiensis KB-1]NNG66640.1 ABC transporter permease [Caldanaerobacter subterraneus]